MGAPRGKKFESTFLDEGPNGACHRVVRGGWQTYFLRKDSLKGITPSQGVKK